MTHCFFFFFQAEDGIRDLYVTGVQTCALPIYSLVHDAGALKLLLKLFGPARVALGSDYPFPLGESTPGKLIQSLKLTAKEKAQLFSGTACDFLGINP